MTIHTTPKTTPAAARWLALGAVGGPIFFTLAWLVLGFLSPGFMLFGTLIAPYSPISTPISGLGLGPTAPYMNTAFVFCGLLMIAGALGSFQGIREMGGGARWTCTVLFALPGLGSVMDGIFTLESFLPHSVGFLLACTTVVGFPVAGLLLRRVPRWRRLGSWLILGGPLTLALVVLYFLTFSPTVAGAEAGVAGLTERILVVELDAWYVALGWLAFRRA
jgi:hypothetical protein